MIFTRRDWGRLATLFEPSADNWGTSPIMGYERVLYAGYDPHKVEAPNGDTKACPDCHGIGRFPSNHRDRQGIECRVCNGAGRVPNTDAGKRYLHVALKYDPPAWAVQYLARAYWELCRVADALAVPDAYYPRPEDTTLRVLEYPAGAGSAEHTDCDLFTIVCWRETPGDLERTLPREPKHWAGGRTTAEAISPGLHIGEIGELVGLGPATPHRVPARPYVQRSIVAFAMPRLDATLRWHAGMGESRGTVREWLDERKRRSRYT